MSTETHKDCWQDVHSSGFWSHDCHRAANVSIYICSCSQFTTGILIHRLSIDCRSTKDFQEMPTGNNDPHRRRICFTPQKRLWGVPTWGRPSNYSKLVLPRKFRVNFTHREAVFPAFPAGCTKCAIWTTKRRENSWNRTMKWTKMRYVYCKSS